ncbi:MAG: 50S ribosomal protein L4 [Candidatus Marinimicrobia bacterium]|jgi:large subunit ribosomal protein L4|nr:50S ribosomal protein L4 [Candidatus Neomarinimicrobiota bacterium]MBT3683106.1 50S ribosomal protein L4 [Candidatus Neomarinimicrobiota bacterium]MBT3759802.1 50S ribosomal protein L4 [Candidatus Neomarinimicrobiota bacterium]MBT3895745.1 50S ribosomal protein L4 [Candidatus Neomarinimicrobiota bacterium]MBT4173216.1 50S ribosomal protein L4 [Candidatus Neomarinimicrobiota bacterium]
MKLNILNQSGNKTKKTVEVSDSVFGIEPNTHCIYLAVKAELASLRQGTSSSKTRGEVSGSNKKPWRQKGTGRSRVGSTRNPSRVHGGAAFGPKPREYNLKVNKKVKRLARISALSDKAANNSIIIVDNLNFDTPKTKAIVSLISKLKLQSKKITILVDELTENLHLGSRNIMNIALISADSASTYDIVDCDILLFDQSGIESINSKLSN